jgi:endonuclease/exonuclease/phosphatase family metal-dependent hydrolase
VRVLTWNLYHGRSRPPAGRELPAEFASLLASWEWDAALLQEVPPWWPPLLARATAAEQRLVPTSRNAALALRRAIARRWPDLIKSNGGGCNAILARRSIVEHRALPLRTWPERRVAQLVRLETGVCVANFHASSKAALARDELQRLCVEALRWSAGAPLVLGGDLNLRSPEVPEHEFLHVAGRDVDHLFARGFAAPRDAELLDREVVSGGVRLELSDHVPLAVALGDASGL